MKIINPSNGEVIKDLVEDTREGLQAKYESLPSGQKKWARVPLNERIGTMARFADLLLKEKDHLAVILTSETGKPIRESVGEVNAAAGKIQFFLQESEKILEKKKVHHEGNTEEFISYDPLGVIANISAWNYPYLVGVNIFVPALICGNSVFYKPSEFALLTGLEIHRLMLIAGFPSDVFEIAIGGPTVGEELLHLPLHGYFFTGSHKTGKYIASKVASKLVPVGLELGGKDPLYVTDEVNNVKKTAQAVASGVFYNNGQSCCSVERLYVHQHIYDEFMKAFLEEVSTFVVGNPLEESTTHGAITRRAHLDYLKNQVDDAISKGGVVKTGGHIIEGSGNFFEPTVIENASHEMMVMKEESFGPIIGVQKIFSDEEAIQLMNDTDFGLTASVYTSNQKRGEAILNEINTGTTYLNCCDRVSAYVPWSGRGQSGLGSTLSPHGIYAFCHPKAWHVRHM